jgi:hypothetical protein
MPTYSKTRHLNCITRHISCSETTVIIGREGKKKRYIPMLRFLDHDEYRDVLVLNPPRDFKLVPRWSFRTGLQTPEIMSPISL